MQAADDCLGPTSAELGSMTRKCKCATFTQDLHECFRAFRIEWLMIWWSECATCGGGRRVYGAARVGNATAEIQRLLTLRVLTGCIRHLCSPQTLLFHLAVYRLPEEMISATARQKKDRFVLKLRRNASETPRHCYGHSTSHEPT